MPMSVTTDKKPNETKKVKKAGIIGLGLLGGSIAKALHTYSGITDIVAYGRRVELLENALREGAITSYTTQIDTHFSDCDVVFICTPVDTIVTQAAALRTVVDRGCIVTDVGSVKSTILQELADIKDFCFIGGHPMAGSEKIGYAAASAELFCNAYYLLTPYPDTPADKLAILRDIVTCFGAIPVIMPPDAHDRAVAAVSHMPHVIASALVNTVHALDDGEPPLRDLAAGGFKDITRIASASPAVWQAISLQNAHEIIQALDLFETQLRMFKEQLTAQKEASLYNFYKDAKTYRDSFYT